MKTFKDLKVGDYFLLNSYTEQIRSIFKKDGFIRINNRFCIPYNHVNANRVKVGSNMIFLDIKQWGKYLHKEVDKKVKNALKLENK